MCRPNLRNICIAMLLLLLLAAGCNKGKGSKQIDTSNPQETAPVTLARPDAEHRDTTLDEEAAAREGEMREGIRKELLAMLPEFSFSHDEGSNSIKGAGLPEAGYPVETLLDKLELRMKKTATNPGPAEFQVAIRVMLTQLQSAGQLGNPSTQAPTEKVDATPDAEEQAKENLLVKAPKVYGEWRSVREEGENYTINHDDQYYRQLLVYYEKDAIYSSFAKGQQIKNDTYDYTYNAGTGELSLKPKDGRYTMKLYCWVRKSEPGMLYVQQQAGQAYTVYEKIGRGEEPWTEEEKAEFLKMQKEIGGSGSGSAKQDKKGK